MSWNIKGSHVCISQVYVYIHSPLPLLHFCRAQYSTMVTRAKHYPMFQHLCKYYISSGKKEIVALFLKIVFAYIGTETLDFLLNLG